MIADLLEDDEEVEVVWTSLFATADLFTKKRLFDESSVGFAISNKKVICTDGKTYLTFPLADFNGVFSTINHGPYGTEMILAMKDRLVAFACHDCNVEALVNAIENIQAELYDVAAAQYSRLYRNDK